MDEVRQVVGGEGQRRSHEPLQLCGVTQCRLSWVEDLRAGLDSPISCSFVRSVSAHSLTPPQSTPDVCTALHLQRGPPPHPVFITPPPSP